MLADLSLARLLLAMDPDKMLLPLFFQFLLKVKTNLKLQSNVSSMNPVKISKLQQS
jgi:hypothetical protein